MKRLVPLLFLALAAAAPTEAWAGRYALLISANRGVAGEPTLRYATSDAEQLGQVLTTLGNFDEANVVVLRDATADSVRRTLGRLNARIRSETRGGRADVLVVFYSGHADAENLHLSGTELSWSELRNGTSKAPAAARLLVVDACRSGQATRVKGTRLSAPFAVPDANEGTVSEGFAILSSAAAGESAQEAELLQGSFFTHHLVVALRGVGDVSGDGQVSLAEAYRYASERTVASTLSTLAGVQHPTYAFDMRGRSDLILTRPPAGKHLARVTLDAPAVYYFRTGGPEGVIAAEASVSEPPRSLRLPGGHYFVQRRTRTRLEEGRLTLKDGAAMTLSQVHWSRVELDQLVRKGGAPRATRSVAFFAGGALSPVDGFGRGALGAVEGALDTRHATLSLQLEFGRAIPKGAALGSRVYELGASVGARRVFDIGRASVAPGIRLGASRFQQHFAEGPIAPDRWQLVPHLDTNLRLELRLWGAWFLGADGGLRARYVRLRGATPESARTETPVRPFATVGMGLRW